MTRPVDNSQDISDSRDVIARLNELEDKRQTLVIDMTNQERSEAALLTVYRHTQNSARQALDENIIDVLVDLMHLCKTEDDDFDQCLEAARISFDCEQGVDDE